MTAIPALAEYAGDGNPPILEVFYPGRGWVRQSMATRASAAWLQKLRAEGAERVSVGFEPRDGGRTFAHGADFTIAELLRSVPAEHRGEDLREMTGCWHCQNVIRGRASRCPTHGEEWA